MKKYIIVLLVCLKGITALAQFNKRFQAPKPPEVYLFEKYGKTPISEYNGRINFSIPLYEVQHGDISFDLHIDYNSN